MEFFTKIKKASAVILSVAMLASVSTPVLAAEPEPNQSTEVDLETANSATITPYGTTRTYRIGTDFVSIPCSFPPDGLFSVIVDNFAPNDYQMDIIMNGRNGMLWQEDDCLHSSNNRVFTCGTDVTHILLRIRPRNRWFPASPKAFTVRASW